MKKLISVILVLATITALFTYAASAARLGAPKITPAPLSSESINLIAGRQDYTLTSDDGKIAYNTLMACDSLCPPTEGVDIGLYRGQVTDGFIRIGTEESVIASDAVPGTTIELAGTNRTHYYTFPLGAEKSVSSVVLKVAKAYGNRGANIVGIEVSADGEAWTNIPFTKTVTPVPYGSQGNANYGVAGAEEDLRDMFYDITASFSAVNASYVRVSLNTTNPDPEVCYINSSGADRGYVLSFDEIEIYGGGVIEDIVKELSLEGSEFSYGGSGLFIGSAPVRFDSKTALDSFMQANQLSSSSEGGVPSTKSVLESYDDAFFADRALFLIPVSASSACRFEITSATYNKNSRILDISCKELCDPLDEHPADECDWFLTLPVLKSDIEGCLDFSVEFTDEQIYSSEDDSDYEESTWDDPSFEPGSWVKDCPEELVPESNHNYPNDIDYTWIVKCSGADAVIGVFSYNSVLVNDGDAIYIYDGNDQLIETFTGANLASEWASVEGDTMKIRLVSDGANTAYGFSFSSLWGEFCMFTPDDDGYDKYLASVWSVELPEGYVEDSSSEDDSSEDISEDESYLEVEDNLLLGKDYTVVTDATVSKADSGNLMTNGAIRGDKDNAWNGDLGVNGVSVEWFGTSKTITYTFAFDQATDVSEIVFRNVRIASNRAFGTVVVNGTNIIMSGQWTKTPVAGAPLYGQDGDATDQYFDVSIAVDLQGITELSIGIITDMYVCQYDEIMAFGTASDIAPSEGNSSEEELGYPTFTVTCTEYDYGSSRSVTVDATLPAGARAFGITIMTSDDLTYIPGSAHSSIGGVVTDHSPLTYGIFVAGASASASEYNEGSIALCIEYTVAEGAVIDENDIIITRWALSSLEGPLANQEDGDVIKIFCREIIDEGPSEEPSEDEPSEEPSEDITSDDSENSSEDVSSEDSYEDESSGDVADVVYGDANGDGNINSLDAAQSLKHDAKLITLDDAALVAADVNGDGTVNSLDAAQILKYDAKLISAFSADGETSE